jgi:hypothetical protein
MDRPSTRRAGVLGLTTAVAFLFRHDHGVYIGGAAVLAFGLARCAGPSSRQRAAMVRDAAAYVAGTGVLLVPWLLAVQLNEGLPQYVRARADLYRMWSADTPYGSLLSMNPVRLLYGTRLNSWIPPLEPARVVLAQITLIVPFLLLGSASVDLTRNWRRGTPPPSDAYRLVLAGVFLAVVNGRLLREPSYAHLVAPMTAALCVRFLTRASPNRLYVRMRLAATVALMFVAGLVGLACMQPTSLFSPSHVGEVSKTFAKLIVSPPIDTFVTEREATQALEGYDKDTGNSANVPVPSEVLLRYLHDCTRSGDHVLVSGSTPYHIGYLVERPIAGGHLFWHWKWRSDPAREAQSLALFESQSVPFAFSTHDPVLDDLKPYPRIREYFLAHYTALPGSQGLLLVDSRRQPTGQFSKLGFPCFK